MAVATNRNARARFALAGEAWAYMGALWRSDWLAASQALTLFQQNYSGYRAAVAAGYPSGAPASLPISLPANGQFNAQTRLAMAAVLLVGLPGQNEQRAAALATIPVSASALGSWWNSRLVPLYPSDSRDQLTQNLWAFDRAVRYGSDSEAGANLSTHSFAVTEGITSDATDFIRQQANEFTREIVDGASAQQPEPNAAANSISNQPGGVQMLPGSLITAVRPERRAATGYYIAGGVLLAGAVGLGWLMYKRRRRR